MTDRQKLHLEETLKAVAEKVRRFKGRFIGEQNTKASLIDPVLEALGWDVRDFDEVHREFKPTPKDSPVDYALKIIKKARLFLEAKGLDENLSDRKWIAQVLGYATVAGVEWCVLSDGDEYRFYNATAPLDADEKLFCRLRLSEVSESEAAQTLSMISRSNMQDNLLDVLWSAHFVDRQVREVLRGLIDSPDPRFVRLIRSAAEKLTPKEIADSIRRLDIQIAPASSLPVAGTSSRRGRVSGANIAQSDDSIPATIPPKARRSKEVDDSNSPKHSTKPAKSKRTTNYIAATLADVIQAGLLKPPLRLFRKYKGKMLEATLNTDGTVRYDGTEYASGSNAAGFARQTVTGRYMSTNGWSFWQYTDDAGKKVTLEETRAVFLKQQSK